MAAVVSPGFAAPRTRLIENTPARIVFEYTTPSWTTNDVLLNGETFQRIVAPGLNPLSDAGRPEIPIDVVNLGIPADRVARVSVQVLETSEVRGVTPPPVATQEFAHRDGDPSAPGGTTFPTLRLVKDAEAYSDAGLYPLENATVSATRWLRHQRVAAIAIQPFRYRASEALLYVTTKMRVTVTLEPAPSGARRVPGSLRDGATGSVPAWVAPPPEPAAWERMFEGALLNATGSRAWRVAPAPVARPSAGPAGTAVPPGARSIGARSAGIGARTHAGSALNPLEYKLQVTRTGFYRVPFESLADFPAGTPTAELKVFQREYVGGTDPIVEHLMPVRVADQGTVGVFDSGDAVIFRGLSFRDEWMTAADWEDAKSDTNCYWLSLQAGAGSPAMPAETAWHDFASPATPDSFVTSDFEEQDLLVFDWSERRTMDMYYWADSTTMVPANLPGIVSTLPVNLDFRVVLQGQKGPYQSGEQGIQDLVTFTLGRPTGGDLLLGSFTHSYTGIPFDFHTSFNGAGWVNGVDSYTIHHSSQIQSDTLYVRQSHTTLLDWYRATYTRRYQLEDYESSLRFDAGGVTGPLEYLVGGFQESGIDLYRLDAAGNPVYQDAAHVEAAGGGRFNLRFQYDEPDSTSFEAVASSAYLLPVATTRIEGEPDLVNDGSSPDYLMIAWDAFLPGLDPLVAYREAQGYRVTAAAVSRVYDLFGNGIASIQAIKNYIQHGFETFGTGFVLLVGDANKDQRGVGVHMPINSSAVDFLPTYYEADWDGVYGEPDYPIRPVDNWYADLSEDADWIPDVAMGRMPVGNLTELATIIQKTITCETPAGAAEAWRRKVLFVADDEYTWNGNDPFHDCWEGSNDGFETASIRMEAVVDSSASGRAVAVPFHLSDILYNFELAGRPPHVTARGDTIHGTCIPAGPSCCVASFVPLGDNVQAYALEHVTPTLFDSLNSGVLIFNYEGHANRLVLTHEYVYEEDPLYNPRWDYLRYTNIDRPFVMLGYACYISQFDVRTEPGLGDGIGERMVLAPNGGAAALYASPGLEFLIDNTVLNTSLNDVLWNSSYGPEASSNLVLGPAIGAGVLVFSGTHRSPDRWRSYHLLGDPALRLEMGAPLATVTVNDSIAQDGQFLAHYTSSGNAHIVATLADEAGLRFRLVNTAVGTDSLTPGVDYQVVVLADSGSATPRRVQLIYDVVVGLAASEIVFTATDVNGHATTFTLRSGISISATADGRAIHEGSAIAPRSEIVVRVDSPVPVDGDSLGLRLDGIDRSDVTRTAITPGGADGGPTLADAWELALPPLDLALGPHTLGVTLTTGGVTMVADSLTFTVRADVDVSYAVAYPNPFSDATTLVYELNPVADRVEVDIYTVAGKRVRHLDRPGDPLPGEPAQNHLDWDGKDEKGDPVASGAYLFRLRAVAQTGAVTEKIGRLVKIAN